MAHPLKTPPCDRTESGAPCPLRGECFAEKMACQQFAKYITGQGKELTRNPTPELYDALFGDAENDELVGSGLGRSDDYLGEQDDIPVTPVHLRVDPAQVGRLSPRVGDPEVATANGSRRPRGSYKVRRDYYQSGSEVAGMVIKDGPYCYAAKATRSKGAVFYRVGCRCGHDMVISHKRIQERRRREANHGLCATCGVGRRGQHLKAKLREDGDKGDSMPGDMSRTISVAFWPAIQQTVVSSRG